MRIVLADDSTLVREGLIRLLAELGHDVVDAVGSATDLLSVVRQGAEPDVIVSDIRMPPRGMDDGLAACLALRAEMPGLPCVLLSQHMERAYALELLADGRGGVGYLLKDRATDIASFGGALVTVSEGGTVLDPALAAALVTRRRDPLDSLTPRENDVLALMAEGRSNVGIQDALVLSAGAVEKHVTSIFGKLQLVNAPDDHRRVLAVLTALGMRQGDHGGEPVAHRRHHR